MKSLALVFSLALALGFLSACGGTTEEVVYSQASLRFASDGVHVSDGITHQTGVHAAVSMSGDVASGGPSFEPNTTCYECSSCTCAGGTCVCDGCKVISCPVEK